MANTGIPYATKALNHLIGCPPPLRSSGCKNCWARGLHDMRHAAFKAGKGMPAQYRKPFGELQVLPGRLEEPLHWRKAQRVFCCPQSDLFHTGVSDEIIAATFGVMAATPRHLYLTLTKRPERMSEWLEWMEVMATRSRAMFSEDPLSWRRAHCLRAAGLRHGVHHQASAGDIEDAGWPLPNVLLGATICDQAEADRVVPVMARLAAQGWRIWLSIEPMLGPVNLGLLGTCPRTWGLGYRSVGEGIEWVVVGNESPATTVQRAGNHDWTAALVKECRDGGAKVYVKQVTTIGRRGLRISTDPSEWHPSVRVQELPDLPEVPHA